MVFMVHLHDVVVFMMLIRSINAKPSDSILLCAQVRDWVLTGDKLSDWRVIGHPAVRLEG